MRAATNLVPLLQAAGSGALPNLWRADEWMQSDPCPGNSTPSGFESLDRELPGRGWPQGQLVELLVDHPGTGELSLLLPALAAVTRAGRTCVWVLPCQAFPGEAESGTTPHPLPYAPVLVEAGIDLARNIFVRPLTARESGWALEQSLRTAHLGALLGWLPEGGGDDADFRCLRRLHLLAQRHRTLVFVLRSTAHARAPSPAALRLQLHHDGSCLQLRLLKRRGRPLIEPIALQVHPARWNRSPAPATPVPVPVPAADPIAPAPSAPGTSASILQMVRALAPGAAWPMQTVPGH
jgi:protein ImuA